MRLLLLLKCLGQPRAAAAFFDPVVRDLLAVDPGITPAMLADWQRALSNGQRQAALRRFHRWQHRVRIAGNANLVLTQTVSVDGQVTVLLDCAGGWLHLAETGMNHRKSVARDVLGLVPPTAARLLVDPALVGAFDGMDTSIEILPLDDERLRGLAQSSPGLAETLSRLDRMEGELAFLTLPEPFRGPAGADLDFSILANGLLRALARRLPGFSRSTLPYLYANFLDFGASVEAEGERYLVRLERPPLHIVLGMTGMLRDRYRLSWLEGRTLELYQEG